MTTAISESPRPETQKLYESLQAEFGNIKVPYGDGTGRCDAYWIDLHGDEDLVTIYHGDDGGMPISGGGRTIWVDANGERAEIDIDDDALWPGSREQRLMFEKVREQRSAEGVKVRIHSGCGVWDVMMDCDS